MDKNFIEHTIHSNSRNYSNLVRRTGPDLRILTPEKNNKIPPFAQP